MNNQLTDEVIYRAIQKVDYELRMAKGAYGEKSRQAELFAVCSAALAELQEHRKAVGPVYQSRIRIGCNGQVTEWGAIRRDQVDFVLRRSRITPSFQIIAAPQPTPAVDVRLPDVSSKAFWSNNGKGEVFHPETYKRWVTEAIERACAIARIDVRVK